MNVKPTHDPESAGPLARWRGFTLIELMVTLAVLAILLAMAVPAFTSVIVRNRVASETSEIVTALAQARTEAIRRNRRVSVCASTDGATCSGSDWTRGLVVFADPGGTGTPGGSNTVLASRAASDRGLVNASNVGSSTSAVMFIRGDGRLRTSAGAIANGCIQVCGSAGGGQYARVLKLVGGVVSVESREGSFTCTALDATTCGS